MSETMNEMREFAFINWSMRLTKPTEPDCPSCMRPESRCACGYITSRNTVELFDAMRSE